MTKKSVGVVFGGKSPEHEVSIESAKTVCAELLKAGFVPVPLYVGRDGAWRLAALRPLLRGAKPSGEPLAPCFGQACFKTASGRRIKSLAVFPLIHGTTGEDGKLQGLLELMDIPYVGSGVLASALGMDKAISKKIAGECGAPVLPHVLIGRADKKRLAPALKKAAAMGFPLFVKPVSLGSSIGIRKVKKADGLRAAVNYAFRYDAAVMIEKGVDRAREIVCGVLGESARCRASVCGEVRPLGRHEFFDYSAKYLDDNGMKFTLPAVISKGLAEDFRGLSVKIFEALGCYGMARIDFLLDPRNEKKFYFCEINTVPGFTSHSLYPRLWHVSGLKPAETVRRLVQLALKRSARNAGVKRNRGR